MRADDWELRCRFNRAGYFERAIAEEFRIEYGESGPASQASGQPPNTISQMAYYYDKTTNEEMAKVHFFLLETGQVGASGRHDPKRLFVDGGRYRQHRGPDINRDPSLEFVDWRRRAYRFFRHLCCRFFDAPGGCAISSFGTRMMRRRP